MFNWKNAIIGLVSAALFSLLYLIGALNALEDRLYDFFLGLRANRERIDNVVFLDVDDQAIMYYGFFPWPRSVIADGLLRLKEYGAHSVVFDIEYIDRGPQGVDNLYLEYGLGTDFERSFSDISTSVQGILSSFGAGRLGRGDVDNFAGILSDFIDEQKQDLYRRVQGVARDNDLYLAQAIALNNNLWATINIWSTFLEGEQAERRPIAERRFSYPINPMPDAFPGTFGVDILPPLPMFAEASKGAGFTNVVIDEDGVRRRVYLTQNVHDHWYLQLTFSPLINFLGNPEISLERRRLTIRQAQMPDGRVKDIAIPLDSRGRMLLDWPKVDYAKEGHYKHLSFAEFSLLDEIEIDIQRYAHALTDTDIYLFAQFDSSLGIIPIQIRDVIELLDAASEARNLAMENTSDDAFNDFIMYRNSAYGILGDIFDSNPSAKIRELSEMLAEEYPESADAITDEAEYIIMLLDAVQVNINDYARITEGNDAILRDKFVIIGWSGTGTTDYGANPFHGKYVNIGTHGVVLDTILSESFIVPVDTWLKILFIMIFVSLFFMFTANLQPVKRAALGFAATLFLLVVAVMVFRITGIFWGPLGFSLAMISAAIIREIISYASSEKEKQFIRSAFSTYVSHDIVKEIIADPSRLQLGGTKRYMTAIFTDVKAFSTISEKLGDPTKLVSLLNKYLSAMSDVVLDEKGTIDKYEGDAIIAFFGAPIEMPDHALRACVSAIKMKKIEIELNKEIMEHGLSPFPLLTRVGINTGYMVAGNMGTANKMNYTIMGDAVNLAARLEGVNKQYGTWIMASEETIKETGDELLYRKLDRVRVVGKSDPVRLCELFDEMKHATYVDIRRVEVFHKALDHFEKRDWELAAKGFKEALDLAEGEDEPAKTYLERSEQFMANPPAADWDGVYNLTSK